MRREHDTLTRTIVYSTYIGVDRVVPHCQTKQTNVYVPHPSSQLGSHLSKPKYQRSLCHGPSPPLVTSNKVEYRCIFVVILHGQHVNV